MPTKSHRLRRSYLRWVPPYWEYPTTDPTESGEIVQTWEDELLLSGGNNGYEIREGLMGAGAGDVGGPFLVHKRTYEEQVLGGGQDVHFSWSTDPNATASPYFRTNQWPYKEAFTSGAFPLPEASSDDTLAGLGATAIARCKPTKPQADLATFIAEAKEGLPSAVGLSLTGQSRARQARNAGDEYLNVEFGWKPLLRDVNSFVHSYRNAKALLDEYHKGAGKLIRRRYKFPTQLDVEEELVGYRYPVPILHPACYMNGGPVALHVIRTVKTEQWFSGAFIYDVPRSDDLFKYIDDANHLYGVKPTPETLWNAAPWTWALDWKLNIGDNISNMQSFISEGLVLHHAYMMEHKTVKHEYYMEMPEDYWYSHRGKHVLRQTFTAETKKRVPATPFGFNVSWEDFTPKQLAILASLGISRTK